MTMTVEMCCGGGRRLTYRIAMNGNEMIMVVESALDGSDAPVIIGGKPSGETMAIRQIDDHHAMAVLKMNGQPFGTAKGTLSADGKTLSGRRRLHVRGSRSARREADGDLDPQVAGLTLSDEFKSRSFFQIHHFELRRRRRATDARIPGGEQRG